MSTIFLSSKNLLQPDRGGLLCPAGGFHIDPGEPSPVALITHAHAHADHARLESLLEALPQDVSCTFPLSPKVEVSNWHEMAELRASSRQRGVEGLMLKRRRGPYRSGRPKGDWWKWKVDPLHLDAVMIYAQAGHGRRSNLFTDYTFAVWRGDELVPVAKAYSGLDNQEIRQLDRWIRQHTRERFGPVRSVEPVQVFELAFDGIQRSTRHKSGVALRFPRIARWRQDKTPQQADRLEQVQALLSAP